MTALDDRIHIITRLREELVGPHVPDDNFRDRVIDPGDESPLSDELRRGPLFDSHGEEIRRTIPLVEFGMGVLHSPGTAVAEPTETAQSDPSLEDEESEESDEEIEPQQAVDREKDSGLVADSDDSDLDIEGCNRLQQSSIGVSFAARIPPNTTLAVLVPDSISFTWQDTGAVSSRPFPVNACYRQITRNSNKGRKISLYQRLPICRGKEGVQTPIEELFTSAQIREAGSSVIIRRLRIPNEVLKLVLEIQLLARKREDYGEDEYLVTITLVNRTSSDVSQLDSTLFQALFAVEPRDGAAVIPYPQAGSPSHSSSDAFTEEEDRLALLYRKVPEWGIGHGCAATWDWRREDHPLTQLLADVFPVTELPSTSPEAIVSDGTKIQIAIQPLAEADPSSDDWWKPLDQLISAYEDWLKSRQTDAEGLTETRDKAAAHNSIRDCELALDRMRSGLQTLRTNKIAFEAFRLANLAMLFQQRAQKDLRRRKLYFDTNRGAVPNGKFISPIDVAESEPKVWRAFQIAFILMCVNDLLDEIVTHHECVDLIWFPTGGGKTEAYLGYAAFAMFLERLRDNAQTNGTPGDGVNVLMRYTLRMLTTQQFQRAGSLICAMEMIRQEPVGSKFGPRTEISGDRFRLGLWIGSQSSPNKRKDAYSRVQRYRRASRDSFDDKHPMVLRECPWCRAEIGKAPKPPRIRQQDYQARCLGGIFETAAIKQVFLQCSDPQCLFGKRGMTLPIDIVDEDIYEHRPSFIIGTVDKFAMLPFQEQVRKLFGFDTSPGNQRVKRPPCLIIQDELHLISGPLGSLYGLYEAIIEQLCHNSSGVNVLPKIICSTATIRGAKDQVQSLFGRSECRLFPPSGLEIGDSFFGRWARDSKHILNSGRMFVGLNAPAYRSALTAQVRSFAACLQAVMDLPEAQRDPWWTLLVFYNSFRDLGGGRTLFQSDIHARLDAITREMDYSISKRRWCPNPMELSGRLSQEEIIDALDSLGVSYEQKTKSGVTGACGACLSSSIIEVGVDVDRLSLMAIVGQPTNTSRYIQVTGRIGRRWWERPGLVLMLYNATRPRDRSHFEQFQSYHQRLYAQVEPTSVTPFSDAALNRTAHAVLIAFIRCALGHTSPRWPSGTNSWPLWDQAVAVLEARIDTAVKTEPSRAKEILAAIANDRSNDWKRWLPTDWVSWSPDDSDLPLLRHPGAYFNHTQRSASWLTATSMRNVDAQCELTITTKYLDDSAASDGAGQ